MNIALLSKSYQVRRLTEKDIDMVYALSSQNEIFYQYHPPFVTKESIQEDITALPPGKDYSDKYYIGFFEDKNLTAIMDLILDYPAEKAAFIGLFMMNLSYQNRGLGSKIISECAEYLKTAGYEKIRLAADRGNPQSNTFWKKNGFRITGEQVTGENEYIVMELAI